MATKKNGIQYTPIDQRDQSTVRAVILARSSNPSATADDMKSQLDQCEDFITAMGWKLMFPASTFTESKTGDARRDRCDRVPTASTHRPQGW